MDLSGIISIAGKPGLYTVVAQSNNGIIVESVSDNKRFPAHASHRISALEDISIYTYDDDIPLSQVYRNIFEKEKGGKAIGHKSSQKELGAYLEQVLPDYDKDRVYGSDIKKLVSWYNLLHESGKLKEKEAGEEAAAEETAPATESDNEAKED